MVSNSRRARAQAGGFMRDFREFALKGNVVDLAIAVIIGGAFGKIISSLVEDVLMPALINPMLSQAGTDWREAVVGPGVKIGSFFGTIIDFVIIAFVLFLIVRSIQKAKRQEEVEAAEAAEPSTDEKLNDTLERLTQVLDAKI
ncbi:MAG: large conductance mechanosensitive channel protein MscL [Cyanobacteria bacterium P01_A01_bin.123]